MIHVPLREVAKRLDPHFFVRVHRCDIVNLAHVTSAKKQNRHIVLNLTDGSTVRASRAGAQLLQPLQR